MLGESIVKSYMSRIRNAFDKIAMDEYRYRLQLIIIPAIFGIISFFMTFVNLITQEFWLMLACGMFFVYCLLTCLLAAFKGRQMIYPKVMFTVGIVCLFTFFLLTGEAEGFSAIWLCTVPCFGLLMFGARWGSILSICVFVELILVLDTPLYGLLHVYEYTNSFRERFPIFYISMLVVGFLFEKMREITHDKLVEAREMYRNIASVDSLTKLYNRHGFNRCIHDALLSTKEKTWLSVLMLDIDYFKTYNDTYGHLSGDSVLEQVSKVLVDVIDQKGEICRWGGEEFIVVAKDFLEEDAAILAQRIRKSVEALGIKNDDTKYNVVTVSIGVFSIKPTKTTTQEEIVRCADIALYFAKEQGRNCVYVYGTPPVSHKDNKTE